MLVSGTVGFSPRLNRRGALADSARCGSVGCHRDWQVHTNAGSGGRGWRYGPLEKEACRGQAVHPAGRCRKAAALNVTPYSGLRHDRDGEAG